MQNMLVGRKKIGLFLILSPLYNGDVGEGREEVLIVLFGQDKTKFYFLVLISHTVDVMYRYLTLFLKENQCTTEKFLCFLSVSYSIIEEDKQKRKIHIKT